jgi:hypothetical protein
VTMHQLARGMHADRRSGRDIRSPGSRRLAFCRRRGKARRPAGAGDGRGAKQPCGHHSTPVPRRYSRCHRVTGHCRYLPGHAPPPGRTASSSVVRPSAPGHPAHRRVGVAVGTCPRPGGFPRRVAASGDHPGAHDRSPPPSRPRRPGSPGDRGFRQPWLRPGSASSRRRRRNPRRVVRRGGAACRWSRPPALLVTRSFSRRACFSRWSSDGQSRRVGRGGALPAPGAQPTRGPVRSAAE